LIVFSGSPATDLQVWVLWLLFILRFFVVSGFAGLLPVVSWGLIDKWLIINTIRFCWFAGSLCESGFTGF
jgi:hypothetical protein